MKFSAFLLEFEGLRLATIEDLISVHEKHSEIYQPEGQKNLFVVETEIIDNRFFWLSWDYDDAVRFRDYVVDSETGERQPNPRSQNQVEPRQQFFALYDNQRQRLFLSSASSIKNTFRRFLVDSAQKEFRIQNIYTSLDDFCARIKTIRGFTFKQVNNMFSRENDIFKVVTDYGGLDVPEHLQLKVSYGDVPVREGRALIDRLHRDKEAFEHVIVTGADDSGIEQTFDFSSIIERIEVDARKDATEHYNPYEVKSLLLAKLR